MPGFRRRPCCFPVLFSFLRLWCAALRLGLLLRICALLRLVALRITLLLRPRLRLGSLGRVRLRSPSYRLASLLRLIYFGRVIYFGLTSFGSTPVLISFGVIARSAVVPLM